MADKLDNLKKAKPFKKNDPRINRNGRPKLPDINEALARVLAAEKDGINAAEAILMALRAKASKGDVKAAEYLLNRGYGKPKETHELKGDLIPIGKVVIVHTDAKSS